jgi:SNF2 family DNA or RNA helicase
MYNEENLIPQPKEMKRNLFHHQLRAIKMMEDLEKSKKIITPSSTIETNIGIYSDMIGYGKTCSMIGLIVRDEMDWNLDSVYIKEVISSVFGNGYIVKKTLLKYKKVNATLIICSTSIIKQWKEEIELSNLRYNIINKKKEIAELKVQDYDVILCIPGLYNLLIEKFELFAWKRFIYDEPTHTKIKSMKSISCGFLWLISSTPYDLIYKSSSSIHFLCNIFSHFMDLNILKYIIIKNEDDYVRKSFQMPPISYHYYDCYQPLLFIVKDLISVSIAEMISAGNIEKAIRQLGGNSSSNIYELIRQDKLSEIETIQIKIEKYHQLQDDDKKNKWIQKKERITEQLINLESRFQTLFNHPCHICLNSLKEPVLVTCCQNIFCGFCFLEWMKTKKTCPICRTNISSPMMFYLQQPSESSLEMKSDFVKKKTKIEILLEILESKPDAKFLIFSNYNETFQIIRDLLSQESIPFIEIKGNLEMREKQLDLFHHSPNHVLFLHSLTNGAGINIQDATDIILYHKMNEDIESQVIGRAFRIGRTIPLHIHYLL